MPIIITETPAIPIPLAPPRKRWTRYECEQLAATGLLDLSQLELIEGELITKMGKKRPHMIVEGGLTMWIAEVFGLLFLQADGTLDVGPQDNPTNEPMSDFVVLNRSFKEIKSSHTRPEDVRLLVEVSDSTLQFDSTTKARLYARAGIVEYWIIDVNGRKAIVHRAPVNGVYTSVVVYTENEPICPLGAPQAEFRAVTVLPDLG